MREAQTIAQRAGSACCPLCGCTIWLEAFDLRIDRAARGLQHSSHVVMNCLAGCSIVITTPLPGSAVICATRPPRNPLAERARAARLAIR